MYIQVFPKPYLEIFRVFMLYCHQRKLKRQHLPLLEINHIKIYLIMQDLKLIVVGRRILYVPRDCNCYLFLLLVSIR